MVCVGAAEGFSEDLPIGIKLLSATAKASAPERRTTASPPSPSGVAMAAMVWSSGKFIVSFEGGAFERIAGLQRRCVRGVWRSQTAATSGITKERWPSRRVNVGNSQPGSPHPVPRGTAALSRNFSCASSATALGRCRVATAPSVRPVAQTAVAGPVLGWPWTWISPLIPVPATSPQYFSRSQSYLTDSVELRYDQAELRNSKASVHQANFG